MTTRYIKDAIAWGGRPLGWVRLSDLNYSDSYKGWLSPPFGRVRNVYHDVYPYEAWMEPYIGTDRNLKKDKKFKRWNT